MSKFHVNTETGAAGACHAKTRPCPLGGETGTENHYGTLEEAQVAGENALSQQHGVFVTKKREEFKADIRKHPDFGNIDKETEMDSTFSIDENGSVVDSPNSVYAPEVYSYEDGTIEGINGWEPVTGFSGQYGYSGPLMHPSEVMGGSNMEKYVRENPGTYALVQPSNGDYTPMAEDDEDYNDYGDDMFVDGWMLLKKSEEPETPVVNSEMVDIYMGGYRAEAGETKDGFISGILTRDGSRVGTYKMNSNTGETVSVFDDEEERNRAEYYVRFSNSSK